MSPPYSVPVSENLPLLAELFDLLPHGVVAYEAVRDERGLIVDYQARYVSAQVLALSGYTIEQLTGQRLFQLRPDARQATSQLRRIVDQRETLDQTYFDELSGRWFALTSQPLGDGFFTTIQDISESKRVTRQNEDQARLFDAVLNSMTSGLSVLEVLRDEQDNLADLRYIRVSQSILNDTGMTENELVGSTMLTHFPAVMQTPFWTAYQQVLQTGQPYHFDGHYADERIDNYLTSTVSRLDENRLISTYTIINDQKRLEQQALEKSAQLKSVLDSCQMPIVLFEAIRNDTGQIIDFRYVIQNEANARAVGHPIAQTTERTMLEVLPGLKPTGIFEQYVSVVETGQPLRFEQYLADDVLNGWFDISIVKQGDGIVVSASNQTLLRQTLQHSEQLVAELQRSNQHLEQFAYVASHDLQEPLRKIQLFSSLLLDQYSREVSVEGQDMLRRVQSAANRMSLLIQDLLSYARLSTGQQLVQSVNLDTLFNDIRGDLEAVISEKNAHITLHRMPTLTGNLVQLRQLFQNLLSNSLKFSRVNVVPRVSVSAHIVSTDQAPAELIDRSVKKWYAIAIADNGIGFDQQQQERIFQLFERLHNRHEYTGTGIGLAICRKVAENHGGTVTAQGQPGKGATFTVYLPKE